MTGLHQLVRTGKRAYRRVGRGQSSTRGKQSGRGGKGQTARAGHKVRPELRDIIKKIPKRRGYGKNRGRTVDGTKLDAVAVSLVRLGERFENGAEINASTLRAAGFIHARRMMPIKIVGSDMIAKKFTITGLAVSASAREAIEKAGGSVAAFVSTGNAQATRTAAKKAAPKKE